MLTRSLCRRGPAASPNWSARLFHRRDLGNIQRARSGAKAIDDQPTLSEHAVHSSQATAAQQRRRWQPHPATKTPNSKAEEGHPKEERGEQESGEEESRAEDRANGSNQEVVSFHLHANAHAHAREAGGKERSGPNQEIVSFHSHANAHAGARLGGKEHSGPNREIVSIRVAELGCRAGLSGPAAEPGCGAGAARRRDMLRKGR